MANIFQYDLPLDEWSTSLQRLSAITPAQATEAARDHLDPDAVVIVVVGDREAIEPGIKELNLGEVRDLATDVESEG
jgi:zinc protease